MCRARTRRRWGATCAATVQRLKAKEGIRPGESLCLSRYEAAFASSEGLKGVRDRDSRRRNQLKQPVEATLGNDDDKRRRTVDVYDAASERTERWRCP